MYIIPYKYSSGVSVWLARGRNEQHQGPAKKIGRAREGSLMPIETIEGQTDLGFPGAHRIRSPVLNIIYITDTDNTHWND